MSAGGAKPAEPEDPWRLNEVVRHRRLREDGKRSLGVNLAEALALSEFLSRFRVLPRK
jgi:hypothetical protein